jgi:rare lipoprotein A (peptidoglycan hydrolase)
MKNNLQVIIGVMMMYVSVIYLAYNIEIKLTDRIESNLNKYKSDSTFLMKCIESKDSIIEAQEKQIKNLKATKICKASYYAEPFHGRKTASGKIYNMYEYTCAAVNSIKLGTMLKVTNVKNNKSIIVKTTDRGAFAKYGRTLDLSYAAFMAIGNPKSGVLKVKIEKV